MNHSSDIYQLLLAVIEKLGCKHMLQRFGNKAPTLAIDDDLSFDDNLSYPDDGSLTIVSPAGMTPVLLIRACKGTVSAICYRWAVATGIGMPVRMEQPDRMSYVSDEYVLFSSDKGEHASNDDILANKNADNILAVMNYIERVTAMLDRAKAMRADFIANLKELVYGKPDTAPVTPRKQGTPRAKRSGIKRRHHE